MADIISFIDPANSLYLDDFGSLGWLAVISAVLMVFATLLSPASTTNRTIIATIVLVLLGRYAFWRLTATLPLDAEWSLDTLWQYAFAAVEMAALAGTCLLWLFQSRHSDRSAQSTRLAGAMTRFPKVDVFIPTYNEAADILERTLVGATAMDYPDYRVWLLDDGRREAIRALAADFGVGYLTRPDGRHAKAGNMNNALAHVMALDAPPDLIAILDADFVPTAKFLSRTVPFFEDTDVGLVQTPQHFFNPDPMQVNLMGEAILPDDQRFAQGVDLPARDAWGVATSCGTSSLVRAASLMEIGGFPTESVCEDTLTSVKLWTIGKRTVFLNETLTQGLAVEGVAELLSQRGRWSLGNMQILRSDWGPLSRHPMPFLGRLFLVSMLSGSIVAPLMRIMIIVAPVIYLFFGSLAIPIDVTELFSYLAPFLIAHYIGMGWISRGANLPVLAEASTTIEYFSTFKAGLVGLFKPAGHKFKVTAKGVERDRSVVHWRLVATLIAPVVLYAVGICMNLADRPLAIANSDSMTVVCLWCYYNTLTLVVGVYLSIDLPRMQRQDAFRVRLDIGLTVDGMLHHRPALSLSPRGATVSGKGLALSLGQAVHLQLPGGFAVPATVGAVRKGEVALDFAFDDRGRRAFMRYLFDGRFVNSVVRCNVLEAATVAFARPLRG